MDAASDMRKKPFFPPRVCSTSMALSVISFSPGKSLAAPSAPEGSFLSVARLSVKTLRSSQTGKLLLQKMPSARLSLGADSSAVLFQLTLYPFLANSA